MNQRNNEVPLTSNTQGQVTKVIIPPKSEIMCPKSNIQKLKWFWVTAVEIDLYQAGQMVTAIPIPSPMYQITLSTPTLTPLATRHTLKPHEQLRSGRSKIPPHDLHQRGVIIQGQETESPQGRQATRLGNKVVQWQGHPNEKSPQVCCQWFHS